MIGKGTLAFDSPHRRGATLVRQARIGPRQRVLDASLYGRIGHGTVFLALLAKRACPEAAVSGTYGDARMLVRARREISAAGLSVEVREGQPWAPGLDPRSFDRILSSLLFHHLPTAEKRRTLEVFHGLLVPGGELHVVDWVRPQSPILAMLFLGVRMSDGFRNTSDHVSGRFPCLMKEAGFATVEELRREIAIPGRLGFYRATKSGED
ncbi:MAG: class I SAM-dependent methyltransferase [Candidatus Binatia bacterium]